jgi:hypothetical protein
MNNTIKSILWVILGIFAISICSVLINQGAEIVADIGKHIQHLTQIGDIRPSHKGFSAFVELVLIAIFVGWTIRRFKNKNKK